MIMNFGIYYYIENHWINILVDYCSFAYRTSHLLVIATITSLYDSSATKYSWFLVL